MRNARAGSVTPPPISTGPPSSTDTPPPPTTGSPLSSDTPSPTSTAPPTTGPCNATCQAAFNVTTGGDYSGTNINPQPTNVVSADDCEYRCYASTACLSFTWLGGGGERFAYLGNDLPALCWFWYFITNFCLPLALLRKGICHHEGHLYVPHF